MGDARYQSTTPLMPRLYDVAGSKQLFVDGKPFLILGAELQNSSMSSARFMKDIWPKLAADNINTVLGAVSWELVEPVEGRFDFSQLDECVRDARASGLRLVLLWFGSFKNGLSTYVPGWVKKDRKRFPRAKLWKTGGRLEMSDIMSVFESEIASADSKAFKALMHHIRAIDEDHSTVIMVQVENEIGVLGDSRDRSEAAERKFHEPVPQSFIDLLHRNWDSLHDSFKSNLLSLEQNRTSSFTSTVAARGLSWPELFDDSLQTDEIFMAYHYAQFAERVAAAGKSAYPIPHFTNVWQNYGAGDRDTSTPVTAGGGDRPGIYPSGGGVINVLDIWQLLAPSLDFIAPDIYLNDYLASCAKYRHRRQPLFIPEQRRDEYGARRIWPAFASFQALGTSPFGIDTVEVEHGSNPFRRHYGLLAQVSGHILAAQARPGSSFGFFFDELPRDATAADPHEAQIFKLGDWQLTIERSFVFGRPSAGSGLVIQVADDRFLLVGWGFQVKFRCTRPKVVFSGMLSFEEREVVDAATGEMRTLRRLNGDETRSGTLAIMPSSNPDYGGFPISITIPAKTGVAEVEVYALDEE